MKEIIMDYETYKHELHEKYKDGVDYALHYVINYLKYEYESALLEQSDYWNDLKTALSKLKEES